MFRTKNSQPMGYQDRYEGLALDYLSKMKIAVMMRQLDLEGNAPHDRPGFLVCHLIGNRASFLRTKAPMLRVPETNFLHGIRSISGRDAQAIFCRRRHQLRRPPPAKINAGSISDRLGTLGQRDYGRA